MDAKKLQELLYDIQRNTLDDAHDLIMEYAADPNGYESEEDESVPQTEIIADNLSISLYQKGDKTVEVRVKLEVPVKMMKSKIWTFENVLV